MTKYRRKIFTGFFLLLLTIAFFNHFYSSQFKANMFNRYASNSESKPDEIIKSLNIKKGFTIADLGSGGGFFTLRFAESTGKNGKVFAVDVDQKLLDIVLKKAKEKGIKNIVPVLAAENNSKLPDKSVDMIFVRNVFHYLKGHVEYFKKIRKALKPGGVIAIVEHNGKGSFMKMASHYTLPADVIKKMEAAGYRVVNKYDYIKYESFIIFEVKTENT